MREGGLTGTAASFGAMAAFVRHEILMGRHFRFCAGKPVDRL